MPSPTDATPGSYIDFSGNNLIDSLVAGTKWGGGAGTYASLTYSFFVSGQSYYATNYSDDNEYLAAYVLSIKQQTAITNALQKWSTVANLTFSQVSDSMTSTGDLRFSGYVNMPNDVAAWAYYPSQSPSGGDTWVGPSTAEETPTPGSYDFMTFTHEIGHAIGLKHPFESEPDNNNTLPAAYDDVRYTVMSYNNSYDFEPTGPMLLDIAAIQYIYGKNLAWQTGNNTYKWAADARIFETLWDAGGTDTIDASNQTRGVGINLNSGEFSSIGQGIYSYDKGTYINNCLNIAYGCTIENAIGSNFNDTIIGNAVANILNGGTGNDTLIGGLGNDTYVVNIATDVISETSTLASEIDTVQAAVSWTLGANLEKLLLIGSAAINATGNTLNNTLIGNAAANILNGGTGNDTLIGGLGNDTYVVNVATDVISETSTLASDIDTVQAAVSWALGANLEKLLLTGSAAINATGNTLNNSLIGNAAANILNGGIGNDTLIGGLGNDTYVVNVATDVISETSTLASEIDTVQAAVSWALGANLEKLLLTGSAAINATGNTLNNSLIGNAAANILNGGIGNDTLIGGLGNDTYVVNVATDVISETSTLASEIDTVQAAVSWTLGANLEKLLLTGSAVINATGNTLNNILIGNAAANILNGGTGNDTLIGGLGNDIYVVDVATDVISETSTLASEIDTVQTAASWTLGANLEKLLLTGSAVINATGNTLNNTLIGNDAANILNGGTGNDTLIGAAGNDVLIGGIGTDRLTGGLGADRFDFNQLSEIGIGALRDIIADFKTSELDKIDLSTLDANSSSAATNEAFAFISNKAFSANATGQLRFADGILYGSTDADISAEFEIQLLGVSNMTSADFIV